jgi:holo-[acyl-carrier protein] synthase
MIVGIGIDVVAPQRIAKSLAEGDGSFETRVFTPRERAACRDRADRVQALAARFAAKEACCKALGVGIGQGIALDSVEVNHVEGGRPDLRLTGSAAERAQALGVHRVHVTLTHEFDVAAAVVVLER